MINGLLLRDAVISASNNINNHRKEVDALNVFPVPDGDTGTNMSLTISAAARELSGTDPKLDVSAIADKLASALLRGARGNSGVILSLIFRGFAKGFKGLGTADGKAVASALAQGTDSAYKAVMKPTEGTMLTVIRLAAKKAAAAASEGADALGVWDAALSAANAALLDTPNMLPVLKKAGVVDAGGQGLIYIFEGMRRVFGGEDMIESNDGTNIAAVSAYTASAASKMDADIEFGYCTEFIVNRSGTEPEPIKLRAYLESIGDSVVVVDDEEIIKVHIHTNDPGNAIQEALKFGPLVNIKIDNMRQQHQNAKWGIDNENHPHEPETPVAAEPEKKYGFVAVVAGEGVSELFMEIGTDTIVSGGQTMNPSTDDILNAIRATPAEHVFVLPNNKNIIMAAEQAIPLADRKVSVLYTRTVPQGITALLTFDEDLSAEENHLAMMKAAEKVNTGLVTFAARSTMVDGMKVNKGEMLGIANGKIICVDTDPVISAYKVTKHMFKKNCSLITIIYGADTTPAQAEQLESMINQKLGDHAEISVIDGGQPVYGFIISVE